MMMSWKTSVNGRSISTSGISGQLIDNLSIVDFGSIVVILVVIRSLNSSTKLLSTVGLLVPEFWVLYAMLEVAMPEYSSCFMECQIFENAAGFPSSPCTHVIHMIPEGSFICFVV